MLAQRRRCGDRIVLRCAQELRRALSHAADAAGEPVSVIARQALREFLANQPERTRLTPPNESASPSAREAALERA